MIRLGGRARQVDILNALSCAVGKGEPFTNGNAESVHRARSMLFHSGCCFIIADEVQFFTHSTVANAQVTKTLGFLRQMGIPLFFIGNYSLGHRLVKRNQEERQRLLSDPLILLPDLPSDPAYVELLSAYKTCSNEVLAIDAERDAADIHWLTGGLRRPLRLLIVEAFKIAKMRSLKLREAVSISMGDLRDAYNSTAFSIHRRDVEDSRLLLGGAAVKGRRDLECPFELAAEQTAMHRRLLEQSRREELSHAMLFSSLTKSEAVKVTRMRRELGFDTPLPVPPPKPPAGRRPPKTAAELLRK